MISPAGASESMWVGMWLLQLCGMLPKRPVVFLPLAECWIMRCMTGGWEKVADSILGKHWCAADSTSCITDSIKKSIHEPIRMPHPWIFPSGRWAPSVLCTPYQHKSSHCGQFTMCAPNQGTEGKLWQTAWEHTQKVGSHLQARDRP